ncbi:MAG TPA: 3-deoxy-D-manno-octulosonic acid kinase [Thioalkalivibrio sp.]|nr:3-deoxy-D-manno-octulosonic acid kinase [Thioalkalivibrio sp.]
MDWSVRRTDSGYLIYDKALPEAPAPWMFDDTALSERDLVRERRGDGRGEVVFHSPPMTGPTGEWVLRHYHRGGAVARLLGDRYLWTGLGRSRPWREFVLTARMYGEGLPVPRPLTAALWTGGPFYRADLVTQRIPGAQPLDALLQQGRLARRTWQDVGRCVRRFHDAGYCHADLNSRNILVDAAQKIWLLDWDRGRRQRSGAWREANLRRLQRDLEKRRRLYEQWHYGDSDFAALRSAYEAVDPANPAAKKHD